MAIYFTSHQENIEWCWSIIAAGAIPVVLSPLSNDPVTLEGQLGNISRTFEEPTVITSAKLIPLFHEPRGLKLKAVDYLSSSVGKLGPVDIVLQPSEDKDALAILLLTSGSTGHSKAVRYTHWQLLESAKAKCALHKIDADMNFMSWTCKHTSAQRDQLSDTTQLLTILPTFARFTSRPCTLALANFMFPQMIW